MKGKFDLFARALLALWLFLTTLVTIAAVKDGMPADMMNILVQALKFIGGPALGAGLAFYVNDYVHRERKQIEERGHLHGAAFAIAALYDDFLNYKVAMRHGLAEMHKMYSANGTPETLWAYAKPHIFTFNKDAIPKVSNLDFILVEKKGRIAYQNIQYLIRAYRNLEDMHEKFNEAAIAQQEKLSDAASSNSKLSAEEIIGKKITAATSDFLMGLVERIEKDEVRYMEAANSLFATAEEHLGGMSGMKKISFSNEKYLAHNLPPLPPIIAKKLAQIK